MLLRFLCLCVVLARNVADAASLRPSRRAECPPFDEGTIVIESYQLYPENADFDLNDCLLYIGALYNASVVVYDPYKAETVATLEFPGITRTRPYHVGGVAWDPSTNFISILVDTAIPHETEDHQIVGDDFIIRYDPATQKELWSLNLTEVSQGQYGGQQDVEHDASGRIYILGSYPGTILRVEPDGSSITPWYLPEVIDHTYNGITGFAATGDILLASDAMNNTGSGEIVRFDMSANQGTPVVVPRTPNEEIFSLDAVYLPPKYSGTVLLVSEHDRGVSVFRSADGKWEAAEYLGRISDYSSLGEGAVNTASVEILGTVYTVDEWFSDPIINGSLAGSRTEFPFVDITSQIDDLLAAAP
ncbi:hypothetical protein GGR52DRAFT_284700 [Hypoxylon sp. FL1284]|nr:hypothetical protein GGR52DRAFT_284700 [Hypoxylon sp. FL1284]